jgi:acyl-CoA thioester hydrolase
LGVRIIFEYECFNQAGELLNTGKVTLVMVEKITNKMCKIPDWFQNAFNAFF